jgi:hypothetical protein
LFRHGSLQLLGQKRQKINVESRDVPAVSEQMIPSFHRAVDIEVPARMIKWAQDLDLLVCGELSQGRKPVENALMASLTLRNLGPAIIGAEQFNLGTDVYTKAYMSGLL